MNNVQLLLEQNDNRLEILINFFAIELVGKKTVP